MSEESSEQADLTARFELTPSELQEAAGALRPPRQRFNLARSKIALLVLAAAAMIYRLSRSTHTGGQVSIGSQSYPPWFVQTLPWVVSVLILFRIGWAFRSPKLNLRETPVVTGKSRVVANESGLTLDHAPMLETTQDGSFDLLPSGAEERIPWSAFENFSQSGELFLLLLTTHSALIIPRRAFINAAQADAFCEMAVDRVAAPSTSARL